MKAIRKILSLLLLLAAAAPMASAMEYPVSVAGAVVPFKLVKTADNTALTGATITGITVNLLKHGATTNAVLGCVTASPSGSNRLCTEQSNGGYTITLTAGDVDTVGNLVLTPVYSTAFSYDVAVEVLSTAFWDAKFNGNLTDVATIASATRAEFDSNSTTIAAVKGQTDQLTFTFPNQVDTRVPSYEIWRGQAQAGSTTTITLDTGASSTNNFYSRMGAAVRILGGAGAGQVAIITAYNGSTKVATVNPAFVTAVDASSIFAIVAPYR